MAGEIGYWPMNNFLNNKMILSIIGIIVLTGCLFILHNYIDFTVEYKDGKPGILITNKNEACNIIKKQAQGV